MDTVTFDTSYLGRGPGTIYVLHIAGTQRAVDHWGTGRTYKSRASARRRVRQILAAHDMGVGALWIQAQPGRPRRARG